MPRLFFFKDLIQIFHWASPTSSYGSPYQGRHYIVFNQQILETGSKKSIALNKKNLDLNQ